MRPLFAVHILSEVLSLMDKELKQELKWLNDNLQAAVKNQAMLYCKLEEMEEEIKKLMPN
jgi:hypothetical protein